MVFYSRQEARVWFVDEMSSESAMLVFDFKVKCHTHACKHHLLYGHEFMKDSLSQSNQVKFIWIASFRHRVMQRARKRNAKRHLHRINRITVHARKACTSNDDRNVTATIRSVHRSLFIWCSNVYCRQHASLAYCTQDLFTLTLAIWINGHAELVIKS